MVGGMKKDIEALCRADLDAIAKTYAVATNLALATVSRQFHGNQAFIAAFVRGEVTVTLSKMAEIVERFAREWPRGVKWPAVVVLRRPKITKVVVEGNPR